MSHSSSRRGSRFDRPASDGAPADAETVNATEADVAAAVAVPGSRESSAAESAAIAASSRHAAAMAIASAAVMAFAAPSFSRMHSRVDSGSASVSPALVPTSPSAPPAQHSRKPSGSTPRMSPMSARSASPSHSRPPMHERPPSLNLAHGQPPLRRPPSSRAAAQPPHIRTPTRTQVESLDPASPVTPEPVVPLRESYLRARARWRKATATILSKGTSALAAKLSFIHGSHIFKRLNHEKQAMAQQLLTKVTFSKGEVLYRQGDYPFLVWFLVSGTCEVSTSLPAPPMDRASLQAQADAALLANHPSAVSSSSRRATEPQLIETHVQRVLDGWYRSPAPDSTPARIHVPLFHLTAPDCIGEREALRKESARDCTVVALTEVTGYALRMLSFRQLTRGRLFELMERALLLKDELVRVRLAHALRMFYERRAVFAPVRSRLSLTPFAERALQRMHQLQHLRAAVESSSQADSSEEKQATPSSSRRTSVQASSSSGMPVTRPSSARPSRLSGSFTRAASKGAAADDATPPSFFPPRSAAQQSEHHRSVLHAQAHLESELVRTFARRAAARKARRAAEQGADTFKYGASQRSKDARAERKAILAKHAGIAPSAQLSSSDDDSTDRDEGNEDDKIASSVWHSFPHAYAEAQWHVYSQSKDDAIEAQRLEREGGEQAGPTLQALHAAQTSRIEEALARHDASLFHAVVTSPYTQNQQQGSGRPGLHARKSVADVLQPREVVPTSMPRDLPLSASFAGTQPESHAAGAATARPSTAAGRMPHTPVSPSKAQHFASANSEDAAAPILVDNLDALTASSSRSASSSSSSKSKAISSLPSPLLSFFSADLLRHLEGHYMRSTEVDPISYTGKWMFFHAPVLKDIMPSRRRVRKPKNWQGFSIPSRKDAARLERVLMNDVLQCSPLGVAEYVPPPPPCTSFICSPRGSERAVNTITTGGDANSEEHWKHLSSPRHAENVRRFIEQEEQAIESLQEMRAATKGSKDGTPVLLSALHSAQGSGSNTPHLRPSSARGVGSQRASGANQFPSARLPADALLLVGSASASASGIPSPPRSSSSRPTSAARRPPNATRRQSHIRHPSLDVLDRTASFGTKERLPGASVNLELRELRAGRMDTRAKAAEQVALALTSAAAAASSASGAGFSPSTSPLQSKRSSRYASRRSTMQRPLPTFLPIAHPDDAPSFDAPPFLAVQGARPANMPAPASAEEMSAQVDAHETQVAVELEQQRAEAPQNASADPAQPRKGPVLGEGIVTAFSNQAVSQQNSLLKYPPPAMSAVRPATAPRRRTLQRPAAPPAIKAPQSSRPASAGGAAVASLHPQRPASAAAARSHPDAVEEKQIVAVVPKLSLSTLSAEQGGLSSPQTHDRFTPLLLSDGSEVSTDYMSAVRFESAAARESQRPSSLASNSARGSLKGSFPARPLPVQRPSTARPSSTHAPVGSAAALLASFDPRTPATKAVRKSLADAALEHAAATNVLGAPPSAVQHPYPPKHAASASVCMAQTHAYVYGRSNAYASHAMRVFSAPQQQAASTLESHAFGPQGGGGHSARSALHSADARALSLYQQLRQFSVSATAPAPKSKIKGAALMRAYEDFAQVPRR